MERKEQKHGRSDASELTFLQDSTKEEIIQRCRELKLALDNAKADVEACKSLLIKLSEQYNQLKARTPDISETEYDKRWSWVNKIVFVLKKIRRPLLSSEIISLILPHEPILQYSRHQAQAFSANLTKAVKYGRVIAHKLGGSRGYYYVLPDWLDINGKLTKEYEDKIFFK